MSMILFVSFFIVFIFAIFIFGRCLSQPYLDYIANQAEDVHWEPEHEYYVKLIGRLVDNILLV